MSMDDEGIDVKHLTYHVIHEVESNHKVNEKEHWACWILKVWLQCNIWVAAGICMPNELVILIPLIC